MITSQSRPGQSRQFCRSLLIGATLLLPLIITGCQRSLTNLQTVSIETQPNQMPVPITDQRCPHQLEVKPFMVLNRREQLFTFTEGHTDVNAAGEFEVEPVSGEDYFIEHAGVNVFSFEGDNLEWRLPDQQVGVLLDYSLGRHFAITGGFQYAVFDAHETWGRSIGIGFFNEGETVATRLDLALSFNESRFDILFVRGEDRALSGNETRNVRFYTYEDLDLYRDHLMMLTLNSRRQEWPMNFFLNYALGTQTFYDATTEFVLFDNNRDAADFRYRETYNSFTGGLFFRTGTMGRLLLGIRAQRFSDKKRQMTSRQLFVQYDITLL